MGRQGWPGRRGPAAVGLALCLCALLGASTRARAAPIVWVAPSWVRVSPTDAPGADTAIALFAARGETESLQIIVRAPAGGLTGVNLQTSDLVGPNGALLPQANLTLYREHYLHVTVPSPDPGGANRPQGVGWYPDGLIPFTDPDTGRALSGAPLTAVPFDLPAETNQPLWVDVLVPRKAPPGEYRGTFTVTSEQGPASIDLSLTVWEFPLPKQPALKSCFGNQDAANGTVAELLRHRLMPRSVKTADERSLADNAGLNAVNAGFWSGASGENCRMGAAPSVTEFQQAVDLHQPDLLLYAYTADEVGGCPNLYATIRQWARNMHRTRLLNLITIAPVPELYSDGSGTGRSAVDIWVVLPKMYDEHQSAVNYVRDKGDLVWSYNCLVQDDYSPKWLVDYAPINYRLQPGFLNQTLGLTGLLYWRVDAWTADPWNDVNTYHGGYPGEGVLVYPGEQVGLPGKVVPSMRLKYLRDGVDDYDYLEMLKQRNFGDWAMGIARGLAPDWRSWTRDPAALEAAREQFGPVLARTFQDVPLGSWAFQQVVACRDAGLVKGYDDGTYRPGRPVTRDQMAVYIARALAGGDQNVPSGPATASFADVPPTQWAYRYIEYAAAAGVVNGYQNGNYGPAARVNRGQMAAFIARSLCQPTGDNGLVGYEPPAAPTFTDVGPTDWHYTYVEYLAAQRVVTGYSDHTYRPTKPVTRDQMAVYIARAFALPLPTDLPGLAPAPAARPDP